MCTAYLLFFFSSRRRHTRFKCDWSSDVCSSDLRSSTTGCWTRACPRHRVRASHSRATRSYSTWTPLCNPIFGAFGRSCESKPGRAQLVTSRKEDRDGDQNIGTAAPLAAAWSGQHPVHVGVRGAVCLVDGRRLPGLMAPSH